MVYHSNILQFYGQILIIVGFCYTVCGVELDVCSIAELGIGAGAIKGLDQ